jgi:hypothetical protein
MKCDNSSIASAGIRQHLAHGNIATQEPALTWHHAVGVGVDLAQLIYELRDLPRGRLLDSALP